MDEKWTALKKINSWTTGPTEARADHLAMTSDELIKLSRVNLFEIGAHSVRHPMLSQLTAKGQEEEITKSKNCLEEKIGRPVTTFAYPHGDYNNDTINILKRQRFTNACIVKTQRVSTQNNPFLLPRFGVVNWDGNEFEKNLQHWLTLT